MKKYFETSIANFYLLDNKKIVKKYKKKYNYLLNRIPLDKLMQVKSKNIIKLSKFNINNNYSEYIFFKNSVSLNLFFRDSYVNYNHLLYIFTQIAKGIDQLHSYNLVHNDIRMMNILINHNKKVKINDFDFLKVLKNNNMKLIDIYSFANILFRLISIPYEWKAIKHLIFTYNIKNLDYSSCINFLDSLKLKQYTNNNSSFKTN